MRRLITACGGAAVAFICTAAALRADELPGFQLDGQRWTYDDGKLKMDGILVKPEGQGPFPAVLISHGLGGSAASFGSQKAREMVRWGLVCIAPNYTHSRDNLGPMGAGGAARPRPGAPRRNDFGASDENLRRAARALDILASLPYVDPRRLAAYGHSMGGFVTIGLAAREPQRLKAAAISGSGIAGRAGYAAPSAESAANIRTPFILFHGADDATVRPEQSAALQAVLDEHQVPVQRHVFEGVGHPVDQQRSSEVFERTRAWLARHGVLDP